MFGLLEFYKGDKMVLKITGDELKKEHPQWDGKFGLGDTFELENEEVRIVSITIPMNDNDNIYKIVVKNIKDSIYSD